MSKKYAKENADLLEKLGFSTDLKGRNEKRFAKRNPIAAQAIQDYLSAEASGSSQEQQLEQMLQQYQYDLALQEQQQEYEANENATQHQTEVADLRAAGLNPALAGGTSSGSSSSGSLNSAVDSSTKTGMPSGTKQSGQVNDSILLNAIMAVAHNHKSDVITQLYHSANDEVNDAKRVVRSEL